MPEPTDFPNDVVPTPAPPQATVPPDASWTRTQRANPPAQGPQGAAAPRSQRPRDTSGDVYQGSTYTFIENLLKRYGLVTMLPTVRRWMEDGMSEDEIVIRMEDTPEFEQRFPGIKQRRDAGLTPLSPAEYIEYEDRARQLMRSYNLPAGFYDRPEDFTRLIVGDVSPDELNHRIQEGYRRVANLDASVKSQFAEFFGPETESDLAAFFLDPDRSMEILDRQTGMAEIGGAARRLGFSLGAEQAKELYGVGVTGEQANQAVQELDEEYDGMRETIEEAQDLTIGTGLAAKFGTSADAADAIRKRRGERMARFQGSGGAITTQQGYTGAGEAKSPR